MKVKKGIFPAKSKEVCDFLYVFKKHLNQNISSMDARSMNYCLELFELTTKMIDKEIGNRMREEAGMTNNIIGNRIDVGNTIDNIRDYARYIFTGNSDMFNDKGILVKIKEVKRVDEVLTNLHKMDYNSTVLGNTNQLITDCRNNPPLSYNDFMFGGDSMLAFKCEQEEDDYEWGKVSEQSVDSTTEQQANAYEGIKKVYTFEVRELQHHCIINQKLEGGWIVLGSKIFDDHTTFILGLPSAKTYCKSPSADM